MTDLTLSEALRENRLEDFIKQQEANGIGSVDCRDDRVRASVTALMYYC
ncbi:hypothetical protein [Mesorhizobium sp. WSM3626]|nr:hypothetical protein [Mesorhizobium sp. WSM3626]